MPIIDFAALAKKHNLFERDILIFDALSAGPATLPSLHQRYCKKSDGKLIARQTFNEYMKRLADAGYIWIGSYPDRTKRDSKWMVRYAVLESRGADLICRIIPFKEREFIRMSRPSKEMFAHESLLSSVIRRIWEEERYRQTFSVEYIYDDAIYKEQQMRKRGTTRGMFFPDIEVRIQAKGYSGFNIHIELDAGQKGRGYWVKKILSWQGLSLVLCTDPERIPYLSYYVEREMKRTIDIKEKRGNHANAQPDVKVVCFQSYADFVKSGITYWFATLGKVGGSEGDHHRVYLYRDGE